MLPTRTEAFERFIEPARAYPQLWRLILGVILATAVYLAFTMAIIVIANAFGLSLFAAMNGAGGPLEASVLLFSFLGMSLGVIAAAKIFQNRDLMSLLGRDRSKVRRHFIVAATIMFVLSVMVQAVYLMLQEPIPYTPIVVWLLLLPTSLGLILIQTSAEELVFRGYLQQQLAARFSSRWVWWVLPSVLFGMLHYEPEAFGPNTWLVVVDTALFGLVAADLTARTGTLGAAIGLHFANNAMIFLFLAPVDDINGLALQLSPLATSDHEAMRIALLSDMALIAFVYWIYLHVMKRLKM